MNILNLLHIAISAIKRNRVRSFLTMLGIIIGVASVITMIAIGQGSNASIKEQISALGTNLITVRPIRQRASGVRLSSAETQTLFIQDVNQIEANCDAIASVSAEVRKNGQAIFGAKNWSTQLFGGDEDYLLIRKYEIASGRNFSQEEIKSGVKFCLLGQAVVENLFEEGVNPIGQTIRFGSIPFKVIGTLVEKGEGTFGQDQDNLIFAPYTTVQRRITRKLSLQSILASAKSEDLIDEATNQIETIVRSSHKLTENEDNDFEIRTQKDLISRFGSVSQMMLVLLGSISAISLIVGGIGIMNIMYVSVTERIKEIGLRLAVGGKSRDILMQFLFEAILLTVIGGIIGVALGIVSSIILGNILGWPVLITIQSILLSFVFCSLIGIFFGWYPARKASKLDPIEALRHE